MMSSMLFLCLLAASLWLSLAWTTTNTYLPSKGPRTYFQSTSPPLHARLQSIYQGPEDEEECADEEECEINWDLMPSDDDEDDDDVSEDASNLNRMVAHVATSADAIASAAVALESSRVRLEVNWQIDECKTDIDSCEDYCIECSGSGKMACRFCRGTNMLALDGDFKACPICDRGKETCESCRGTGFIAPWATTMDKHIHKKKP